MDIDVKKLDEAYRKGAQAKAAEYAAKAKASGMPEADEKGFEEIQDTFCGGWPKVKPFLKLAIKLLAMVYPVAAAKAQGFVNAVDTVIIPVVCAK